MLQQGLGRSAEQNRGLGGEIRFESGPYLLLFLLLHGGRPGSGRPSTTIENYIATREISTVSDKSLQCLPCAAPKAHPAMRQSTCTELEVFEEL